MKRHLFLLVFSFLFLSGPLIAQVHPLVIDKVDSVMAVSAKPLLILLSTDWCTYCQMQKKQLQKNRDFQEQGDLFHYIEFDAESKKTVRFKGIDYTFKPTGASTGIHLLALALNGPERISFPTWVLLDKDYQVLFRHRGVLSSKQMQELLQAISFHKHSP